MANEKNLRDQAMTEMTFEEAKEVSLEKWRSIRVEVRLKAINLSHLRSVCGFCKKYSHNNNRGCQKCPLFPMYCVNDPIDFEPVPLYWRIEDAVMDDNIALISSLVDEMIKAIEEAEE